MRRLAAFTFSALFALGAIAPALPAHAQKKPAQEDEDAKKKKRDEEWGNKQAPLPALRNAGPCPYVKVLYDASRYVELAGQREAPDAVGFTGEIQSLSSGCSYKNDEPINVAVNILFGLGHGPRATGMKKTYRYWVAVTDRNNAVIDKQYFDLPVEFPKGEDRISVNEQLENIVIPRATATVSGANFEVLIGFDITPQMAEFNRAGKRFRADAVATAAPPAKTP